MSDDDCSDIQSDIHSILTLYGDEFLQVFNRLQQYIPSYYSREEHFYFIVFWGLVILYCFNGLCCMNNEFLISGTIPEQDNPKHRLHALLDYFDSVQATILPSAVNALLRTKFVREYSLKPERVMSSRVLQALGVKQPDTLFTPPIAKAHAYLLGGHAAVKKGLSYMMGLVPESYADKLSDDFANVVLPLSLITRKNGVYHCLHMVKQAGHSAPKFLVNSEGVTPQADYANLIPKVHKAHKTWCFCGI